MLGDNELENNDKSSDGAILDAYVNVMKATVLRKQVLRNYQVFIVAHISHGNSRTNF